MKNIGINTAADIAAFFKAFNERQYDVLFEKYMADDCFWYASESPLYGKGEIMDYWTHYHSAFSESLSMPEQVVFGENKVYLQAGVRLEFTEDGSFFGKVYKKGEILHFGCVDYYELNEERKIRKGLVYVKFFNDEN